MPDYKDLTLRYTDGESLAQLLYGTEGKIIQWPVTYIPPPPTENEVTTVAQLIEASKTPGKYRIRPAEYLANLTTSADEIRFDCDDGVIIKAKEPSLPALQVSSNAFAMYGGKLTGAINETIICGSFNATSIAQQPDQVYFDGTFCQANPEGGKRGWALHTNGITLRNCQARGYYRIGQEVQAIWVCNGPGPYTFENCFLEGAGENFLAGGAKVNIVNCVPSDLTFRNCTFYKPEIWRTNGATVKNLFELKNAQRVLIENCLFDGCWAQGQNGNAIVWTVRNTAKAEGSGDNPWVIVDQIAMRHCMVRRAPQGYGIGILGHDDGGRASQQTKNITVEDCLFVDQKYIGVFVNNGVSENLTIRRCTFPAVTNSLVSFNDTAKTYKSVLHVTDNVHLTGYYVVTMSGGPGKGIPTLDAACTSYEWTRNVMEKYQYTNSAGQPAYGSAPLPVGNIYLANGVKMNYNDEWVAVDYPNAGWTGMAEIPPIPVP